MGNKICLNCIHYDRWTNTYGMCKLADSLNYIKSVDHTCSNWDLAYNALIIDTFQKGETDEEKRWVVTGNGLLAYGPNPDDTLFKYKSHLVKILENYEEEDEEA